MDKPKTPEDEIHRLDVLRSLNILDTPPEERFDSITRVAKKLFSVPIALVSIVDEDRQWFKSKAGLDANETPREISFCGHAILHDDAFIVPDTKKDERFADNPLVLEPPYIRFYAGYPLRTMDGLKLGTLCIIDTKPRRLSRVNIQMLSDLGAMVERELTLTQLATLGQQLYQEKRDGVAGPTTRNQLAEFKQTLSASLIFITLEDTSSISDTAGQTEADRSFTALIQDSCRQSDFLERLENGTFAILLPHSSTERAQKVVSRLSEAVKRDNQQAQRGYHLSFSHNIVKFDPDEHNAILETFIEGSALI